MSNKMHARNILTQSGAQRFTIVLKIDIGPTITVVKKTHVYLCHFYGE